MKPGTEPYVHRQSANVMLYGLVGLAVLGGVAASFTSVYVQQGHHAAPAQPPLVIVLIPGLVALIGIVTLVLFSSLTIQVDDSVLGWWFGPGSPGLIRKAVALGDVRDVAVVRNPWWYGWGIHFTPRGWLYNISGGGAVEVTLRSGTRFRLGTDEPDILAQAILDRTGA